MTAPAALADLEQLRRQAASLASLARAESTLKGYRQDWRHFSTWCAVYGLAALPADKETVCLYLTSMVRRGLKPGTIKHAISTIAYHHDIAGIPSPTRTVEVKHTHAGIKRQLGTIPTRKAPLTAEHLVQIVASIPAGPRGTRDKALLLVGWMGALRKSEICGLDYVDTTFTTNGVILRLRAAKADKERAGQTVGVPHGANPETCPVDALRAWLALRGDHAGPLFSSVTHGGRVSRYRLDPCAPAGIVKRCVSRIGLDSSKYSSHSLRRGFITTAAHKEGANIPRLMEHTRHKSYAAIFPYIEHAAVFANNPAAAIGL